MKKGIFFDFIGRGQAAQRAVDELAGNNKRLVGAEARDVANLVLRLSGALGILEELVDVDANRYEPLRQRVWDLLQDVRRLAQ